MAPVFENMYIVFFPKYKKTRVLRFLEITSQKNISKFQNDYDASLRCALWNNKQLHINATLYKIVY